MNRYFILNFTPTGMIPTREMTPHVPIRPGEIVEQVSEAVELGANMIHLHARDPDNGEPTYKKEIYADIIRGIRNRHKDVILGVSTSGRQFTKFEQRSEVLDLKGELKPDFASLTLSSLNFNKQASINEPRMIRRLVEKMRQSGIRPEFEAFDLGMINYAKYLANKQLVSAPFYFNLILGNIACAQANLLTLGLMERELPEKSFWSAGGIGNFQLKVNLMALSAGGGIRIGLEDNIWYDPHRKQLATNFLLIKRIREIADSLGLAPYPLRQARKLLGLS